MAAPKPNKPAAHAAKPASNKPFAKQTAKASGKPKGKADDAGAERVVSENRRARHDYEILDTLECGIALVGSEVKSLRGGRLSLDEAYGRLEGQEVWLLGCDIPEYEKANQLNHPTKRPRKLLLHRREIGRFASQALEKGLTLVPLKMYFKNGRVKVLMGIGRGRQTHDKRQKLKAETAKRDIEIALRGRTGRGGRSQD
ncbi:MAG: SsrA-binding protein [Planctomycetota bacterium]